MPTYEYVCKSCGHLFEIVQSMKDDPLTECPECEGELRKVFAPPAISFKGSGFYATDHGKKSKQLADSTGGHSSEKAASTPGPKEKSSSDAGSSGSSESSSKDGGASGSPAKERSAGSKEPSPS